MTVSWDDVAAAVTAARHATLSTVTTAGLPHAVPVLAVWASGAPWFSAAPGSRKAGHLRRQPACVLTVGADGMDLVLAGDARPVDEPGSLAALVQAYDGAYGWRPEVRGGRLWADGAPTAGAPPYQAYRVALRRVFAFPTTDGFQPTRFRFGPEGEEPVAQPWTEPGTGAG